MEINDSKNNKQIYEARKEKSPALKVCCKYNKISVEILIYSVLVCLRNGQFHAN